ncbi:MAG: hypothetical protein M1834_004878 [Cirrosporium novae-zelandiae]|nr:MAG: hypothetical protein M1834_004878 [Cirrosporium novae-zelandiae]
MTSAIPAASVPADDETENLSYVDSNIDNSTVDGSVTDDSGSVTCTLDSSANNFEFRNGRRYHVYKAGKYDLPNDEQEQERLNLQHHAWIDIVGALQIAPIPNDLHDVLDIDDYMHSTYTASPIQPTFVPPNCEFEIDDCESDWIYHRRFDFIHGRTLTIGWRDWDKLCRQSFKFLNPGGYLELQEATYPAICDCPPDKHPLNPVTEYFLRITDAAKKRKIDTKLSGELMAERMRKAGFINIHYKTYRAWLSNRYFHKDLLDGLEGIGLRLFTEQLGWSTEKALVYISQVRNAMKEETVNHLYFPIWICYGQKPPVEDEFTKDEQ